jgi:thiamine biosynthesis lipoprotein
VTFITKLKVELLRTFIAFTLLCQPLLSPAQENKAPQPTLIIFSGSDWCMPCIRFDKDVRQDPQFKQFASQFLNIVVADFPQRKKLDKALVKRNEELAERYNPNGMFPFVLLLDQSGEVLTEVETNKVTPKTVIDQISKYLPANNLIEHQRSAILMGSAFHITLIASRDRGAKLLDDCINEIISIEAWLSSWKKGSLTSKINDNAGKMEVPVDEEYYQLVMRCNKISELTQGAFDISFQGVNKLYTFDRREHKLPAKHEVNRIISAIGYEKINLEETNYIGLEDSLMRIGFGAIGKGYAAERVKKLMLAKGVNSGVINASGDLTTWGRRINGKPWNVGIPNPENKDEIVLWLPLEEKAIATSGDYEKYFTEDGVRYSHIINPVTGFPVIGSRSVSVISESAELSDAMATAVAVLGLEVGLNLINQLSGVECVFIDNSGKLHLSDGLKPYEN